MNQPILDLLCGSFRTHHYYIEELEMKGEEEKENG